MGETISIDGFFGVVIKRWKLIVLLTLLLSLASAVISYIFLTPVYQASTQILVNQKDSKNQLDVTQLNSSIQLINTYGEIIKSPIILDEVIKNLSLTQSSEQLTRKIKIKSQGESQIFSIIVEDSNPKLAVEIANELTFIFQEKIKKIMSVDNVSILAKAEMKSHPIPIRPNPKLNIIIATAAGLLFSIGLSLLIEYMDHSIKDGEDAKVYLGLPVIGTIQSIPHYKVKRIKEDSVTKNAEGEAFET